MTSLSSVLGIGPGNIIAEYEGGVNYQNLGTLSKTVYENWGLSKETCATCASSSSDRLEEIPLGTFRDGCILRSFVQSIDTGKWDQIIWTVDNLPESYERYSDNLMEYVVNTGLVSAIRYTMSIRESKKGRAMFRGAIMDAFKKEKYEAVKYLCEYFDRDFHLMEAVSKAIAEKGDIALLDWFVTTMRRWYVGGTRQFMVNGNIEALEYLKEKNEIIRSDQYVIYTAIGGHVEAMDWVLDNVYSEFNDREVCLMACSKGNLEMFKHLVYNRGFHFNRVECVRYARRGSGIIEWLESH